MEGGTCAAPDGSAKSWSLSPRTATIAVSILGFTPILLYLLVPKLVFWIGGWFGHRLKRQTEGRRKQILQSKEADEKKWWDKLKTGGEGTAEDWERFQQKTEEMFVEQKSPEFGGVIGFFHPFW
jgi:hypothetical protein